MRHLIYSLIFISIIFPNFALGQNNMIIHQGNGTKIILPLQSIDSVRYQLTPPPVLKKIYQNNGNILSVSVSNIDSITFFTPNINTLPVLSTQNVSVLSNSLATGGGTVISDGGFSVTQRGICWSTSPNPTIANNFTTDGNGLGAFSSTMTPLLPSTTYYARAYATNSKGTAYGNQVVFITSAASSLGIIPTISTNQVTYQDSLSALCGGNITADGGLAVTSRGVCWAIGTTPTINNSLTIDGAGGGTFNSRAFNLMPNTTYFIRAYATNAAGTAYGITYSFTTKGYAIVKTDSVSTVWATYAKVHGNVVSDGGSTVSDRGICWSTSPNPSIANNKVSPNAWNLNTYYSFASSLPPNTIIYFRAFAGNSIGYAYGNEISVKTKTGIPILVIDSITNVRAFKSSISSKVINDGGDPNSIIQIGVCWSTSPNPTINDSITNDIGQLNSYVSNPKNLNPNTTYYVRSYAKTNIGIVGYSSQLSFKTRDGNLIVILDSTFEIMAYNAKASSKIIDDGGLDIISKGICWSTSPNPLIINDTSILYENNTGIFINNLKNLSPNTLYYIRPFVITNFNNNQTSTFYGNSLNINTKDGIPILKIDTIFNIRQYDIKVKSIINSSGGAEINSQGICWSTSPNPTIQDSKINNPYNQDTIISLILGLSHNTIYYIKSYATTNAGTGYSNQKVVTTLDSGSYYCNGAPTSIVDIINPITGRTWMDRNLGAQRAAINLWDNLAYGDLYQWGRRADGHQCRNSPTSIIQSASDQPHNGNFIVPQGNCRQDWRCPQKGNLWDKGEQNNPCPEGYTVPTDGELNNERLSWDGFISNNTIKLVYSGKRGITNMGEINSVGSSGNYWSNTPYWIGILPPWSDFSWSRYLSFSGGPGNSSIGTTVRGEGLSVRCIKLEGSIASIDCGNATNNGNIKADTIFSGVNSIIPYTGGVSGTHNGQIINSTGVTGLTATLLPGIFSNGNGTLMYSISGNPTYGGIAYFNINIAGKSCILSRVVDTPNAKITNLNCSSINNIGKLDSGLTANNCVSKIQYSGGNGGKYLSQSFQSTGVTGLTATLNQNKVSFDTGTFNITITGTPIGNGDTVYFNLNILGKFCLLKWANNKPFRYPIGTVFCNTISIAKNEITNPITGKTWMDRNLGASRAALNSNDSLAFGDLYQWGRRADGHQCRNSDTTSALSSIDQPAHSKFILSTVSPFDWRNPQNNSLWQGVNGINNPCPNGYRIPTETECNNEGLTWSSSNAMGAFNSNLKLTLAGFRRRENGLVVINWNQGMYQTSTIIGTNIKLFVFSNSSSSLFLTDNRSWGASVRCIKN